MDVYTHWSNNGGSCIADYVMKKAQLLAFVLRDHHSNVYIYCARQNAYYLRRFSFPRILRCPAGIDRGCWVISGFGRNLGLTHLASMSCWQRSDDDGCSWWSAKKKTRTQTGNRLLTRYKATKHIERTFLSSDYCYYVQNLNAVLLISQMGSPLLQKP